MSMILYCTASSLRAMLAFIDPQVGPRIAGDDGSLADALVEKVKKAVGDSHGTMNVSIFFNPGEEKIAKQFFKVAKNCSQVFDNIAGITGRFLKSK